MLLLSSAEQIGKPDVSRVSASSAVKSLLSSEETALTGYHGDWCEPRPFQSIQEPLTAEGAESAEQIGKPNVSAFSASSAVKTLLSSEEPEVTE